ncbi:MAG TPA: response regulator [Candidatus Dormibacteraeota bacterium]|nr:response regulator [Candidatus Dormibacteraeota bacterium]
MSGSTSDGADARPRVLIVDDNPNKLVALAAALAPLDVEAVCVSSGRDALRHLLRHDAAVVVLDVHMPDMDGFETAALIRSRQRNERVPILFVTALDQAEAEMSRGFELGAVDFVLAPIAPEVLRNKVSVLVDLYAASAQVRRQADRLVRLAALRHRSSLELAESGRRRAEKRFASVLDIAGDPIIAVDADRRIVIFNRAAERVFGLEAGAAVGRPVDDLIVEPAALALAGAADASAGAVVTLEVQGRRADGDLFPAEVTVSETVDDDGLLLTVILRDVTERRVNEERLRQLHDALDERLRLGIDMVAALAESLDAELVLGRLLVQAASAVGAERGTLLRLDVDTGAVRDTRELNHAGAFDRSIDVASQPMLREAVLSRVPVITGEFEERLLPAAAAAWGGAPRHVAAVPLVSRDACLAVLLLCREQSEPFSATDVDTLGLIADVAVVALRNADLYARAEALSRSKSDFLNLAAHELRTPLSVVRGYVSMLADGSLGATPPAWTRPLETVSLKVDELNVIVDDLLTAARVEGDGIAAAVCPVDLREIAAQAASRHAPRVELLRGALSLQLPDDAVFVLADPTLSARIVDNLVNNALTYSVGPPCVRIRVDASDRTLRVEDRGPGVPEEVRGRVFERFVRADHPRIGPRAGTGLGLYIGRALAVRQQAQLLLESTGPAGTTFALAFPPVAEVTVGRAVARVTA